MKIATLGSCQAMALNWYLHQLLPDCESKWVSPEIFQFWSKKPEYSSTNSVWKTQVHHNIFDTDDYDTSAKDPLQGMVDREEELLPDIKVSKLISENPNQEHFKFNQKGTHCNSVVFLEILREVCKKLEWSFFWR